MTAPYAAAVVIEVVGILLFRRLLTSIPAAILIVGPFLLIADLALALFERPGKERTNDLSLPGGLPIK